MNPDQVLLHRFLAGAAGPAPMDTNPLAAALGARLLQVDAVRQRVVLDFLPGPLFVQGSGVLQGGAVASMLDFAMAFATLAVLPMERRCATVQLATSFLRAAPAGRCQAIGEIEKLGRSMAFTRAELRPADGGPLLATASSTLAIA